MSSDRPLPSLRRRIVAVSLAAGAVLFLLAGGVTFAVAYRVLRAEEMAMLAELADGLAEAVAAAGGDMAALQRDFDETLELFGPDDTALLLAGPDGTPLLHAAPETLPFPALAAAARAPDGDTRIAAKGPSQRRKPVSARARTATLPDGRRIVAAIDVSEQERNLSLFAAIMCGAFLLAIVPGGLLADWLARRFVRSLRNLTDAAGRIRAGEWSARAAPSRECREITLLEDTFNTMCDRNERTLDEMRTLTDDIAHDLRTPLTRLRTAAELSAMGGTLPEPLPDLVCEQTADMLDLVNTLLDISRAGCRLDGTPPAPIDLVAFLQETADLYSTLLEDRRLRLDLDLPPAPLLIPAHRDRLQRIVGNLLDNAIKFTPDGGTIGLGLSPSAGGVRLHVTDTGRGIAPEDLPNIYRRFWRADTSRTLPGNGLGLALVQALVRSYGGTIDCASAPGRGTRFSIFLPAPSAS